MLEACIREDPLRALYRHWRTLGNDRHRIPGREAMDVLDLPVIALPHAFIYEREDDGRFRCRLAGTRFAEDLGYEPTWRHLDDALDPVRDRRRLALFAECLDTPRAIYYRGRLTPVGHDHRESGRLLLPVADADGTLTFVFGGMIVGRVAGTRPTRADADGLIEVHRNAPVDAALVEATGTGFQDSTSTCRAINPRIIAGNSSR